jgi:hypothetical protein
MVEHGGGFELRDERTGICWAAKRTAFRMGINFLDIAETVVGRRGAFFEHKAQ